MLDALDQYYREQGIPAIGFNCKHRAACSALCAPGKMISVPESHVGAGYEEGTLPRLLFVSSDTNNPEWLKDNPEWGALRGIRDLTWNHRNESWNQKPNGHWHQTLLLAQALLSPFAKDRSEKISNLNDFVRHIANARSTRCKDISIGTKEGKSGMSANCYGFLKGEIEIMCPDIIVTQGNRARNALWNVFPVIKKIPMPGYPATFYEIIKISETRTAIKIVAKHPCARGRNGWKRGEKKVFIDWATQCVQTFIPIG